LCSFLHTVRIGTVRKLSWAGVILGTASLLFLGLSALLDLPEPPHGSDGAQRQFIGIGEGYPVLPALKIGVLGDSQKGLANLRNITRSVLNENVGLLLHTGDLVSNNDEGHYKLANRYLVKGGATGLPFVAPGNHDVKGNADRFLRWCGPLEQSFSHQEVTLVLLNNPHGTPPDAEHVQKLIAAAGPHKAVVLLMHQPPFDVQGNSKPEYASFLAWLEKSKVAYLLCGHEHCYIRKKVGDTIVIINGVGGDYDKWQLNQKVCATILEVEGAKITDRKIEIEPAHEIWENIEHFAVGHVSEAYRQRPLLSWLGTLLLAGGVGWGWFRLLRGTRQRDSN